MDTMHPIEKLMADATRSAAAAKGFTNAELAKRAGGRAATLTNWFRGNVSINMRTAVAVWDVLGLAPFSSQPLPRAPKQKTRPAKAERAK